MGFINIKNSVDRIETSNQRTKASAALQKIFKEKGNAIISDEKALGALIDEAEFSEVAKLRIKLVLSCTSVRNYLSGDTIDLKMTQVDNMIHVICMNTGLTYIAAVETLSEILCALGLDYTITYSPVLEGDKIEHKIHTVMPADVAKKETLRVTKAFGAVEKLNGDCSEQEAKDILEDIKKLCSAGIPDGFYMLAKCYGFGYLNTAKNKEKYQELLELAAEAGSSEAASDYANTLYGKDDLFTRSFEKAYYYLTKPGSIALKEEQRRAVEDIYKQKSENKVSLVFSVVMVILSVAFLVFFNSGMFSGSSRLVVGIIFAVLNTIISVFNFLCYYRLSKFDSIRWGVTIQFVLWAIYIFILELA